MQLIEGRTFVEWYRNLFLCVSISGTLTLQSHGCTGTESSLSTTRDRETNKRHPFYPQQSQRV